MSSEWQRTKWGEIASLEYGKAIRGYQNAEGPYPVYGTNGPIGWHDTALCKTAGVVIGRKGAYRGVHYSSRPFYVIDTAFYLKPKIDLDMRWAYYSLLTCDINGMDSGSAIPSTSRDEFYKLPVVVPCLREQKEIAAILASFDDRITLLRETNATLEAIAQALFKSWFVDFDPVHAKQAGHAPEGMDEATAALFPDGFEESALGLVPRGWRVGSLGDIAELNKESISPTKHSETLFEHYSLPSFDNGQAPVFEVGAGIKSNKTVVPPDAVLLSKLNPHIPRVWLPTSPGSNAVCSTEFLAFVPKNGASRYFVYCTFSAAQFQQSLCQLVTGTSNSHQRVKSNGVLQVASVIPTVDVLGCFAEVVAPIFDRVGHNRHQAQTLATLRDTLLPRLISGWLRLPEAEAIVEEAS